MKDNYWYCEDIGKVWMKTWVNDSWDNGRFALGNCFRTEREAEEYRTRQQMLTKWERLSIEAGEEENDWNSTSQHWYVNYSYKDNRLYYTYAYFARSGDIFFPTKESCQAATKELGEENVKKYILNIKED